MVEKLGGVIDKQSFKGFRAANLASMLGLPDGATLQQVDALLDKVQKQYDGTPDRIRVTPASGSTVLPSMGGKDDIDHTTDAIERQIAKMQADADAAGKGAAELERLRVEAQLYAAAERAGITDTEKFADRFYNLAERAGEAADALAKAKVNAEIKFGRKHRVAVAGRRLQIATQLKDIYPDVTTALNSAEAAQLRFNKTLKDGADAFQSAAAPALLDFETGAKKGSDAIKAFEQQFIKSLLSMANQALIFGPISRALQGVATGGISNLFGSAHGNVFSGGSIVPFAQGGVVDSPTIAPMALFGEAGPEAIMPLRRGADGNLGVAGAGGGGNTHITYQIDASGADSGTVEKIKAVLGQHARDIAKQAKATKSASRMQSSGVS
jgi:hypothetical protein